MKRRLFIFFVMACMLVSAGAAHSATTLMQIGRSPFCKPLKSADDLVTMVQSRADEVEKGFALAGRSDLYQPFMAQIGTTRIEKKEFPRGAHLEWMFFKKRGTGPIRVARDVTWANEKPFPGFQFDIVAGGKQVTFVVPLGCGNVALLGESRVPVAQTPVARQNQAPTCGAIVTPTKAFCGDKITVDARNSSDPDGSIVKMNITVADKNSKIFSEKAVDGNAADITMPCGTNTVQVTVIDNEGAKASSALCTVEVTGIKRIRPVADVGYYRQFDPGHYLFGRIGGEYRFTEQWSVLGLVGGAWLFEGRDGSNALLLDLLGEYKFSRYYVDLGVGGWLTDGNDSLVAEDDDLELIASFGARVFGDPEGFNGSVFVEARSGFDELEDIADYGRFGIGMRFRF